LTHPIYGLLLMGAAMFAWHAPALYELALRSPAWHQVEHSCFFLTSIVFWWPVVQPWPSRAQWPRWAMVPYLLVADLQNSALSAVLTFFDRVLYPSYSAVPRLFGLSALEDQAAAGAMMWVVGSLAFVVPAVLIAVQCLSKKSAQPESAAVRKHRRPLEEELLPAPQAAPTVPRLARERFSKKTLEAASFVVLFAAAGLCFARLLAIPGDDDDQALKFQGTSGPFAIAVFAPSGDLPAGPTPFSVLVQDRITREVLLDAAVDLTARPATALSAQTAAAQASHEESENKLLQSAELNLASAGDWTLSVVVQRDSTGEFSLPLQVVKEEPGITFPWPYTALLALAAILLLTYVRRHRAPKAVASIPRVA
jgi:hypothetical protein